MKTTLLILTFSGGLITIIQSCKKNTNIDTGAQTINQTIRVNQTYQYDLGNFGYEEGAFISKQATNFSISTVDREINTGKIIYKYAPATNFIGTDEVEIKSARGSDGASPNYKILYTKIKFTITN